MANVHVSEQFLTPADKRAEIIRRFAGGPPTGPRGPPHAQSGIPTKSKCSLKEVSPPSSVEQPPCSSGANRKSGALPPLREIVVNDVTMVALPRLGLGSSVKSRKLKMATCAVKHVNKVDSDPREGFPVELFMEDLPAQEWDKLLCDIAGIEQYEDLMALADCLSSQAEEATVLAAMMDVKETEMDSKAETASNAETDPKAEAGTMATKAEAASIAAGEAESRTPTDANKVSPDGKENFRPSKKSKCVRYYDVGARGGAMSSSDPLRIVNVNEVSSSSSSNEINENSFKASMIEKIEEDKGKTPKELRLAHQLAKQLNAIGKTKKALQQEEQLRRRLKAMEARDSRKTWKECQQILNERHCTPSCPCMCDATTRQRRKEQATYLDSKINRASVFVNPTRKVVVGSEPDRETVMGNNCPVHSAVRQRLFKRASEKGWSTNLEEFTTRLAAIESEEGPRLPNPDLTSVSSPASTPQGFTDAT